MMPLAYSEINNGNTEIKKKPKKRCNQTIKKRRSNQKVRTFLNSMNKKESFSSEGAGRSRSSGASTLKNVKAYDSDDEIGEPYHAEVNHDNEEDVEANAAPPQQVELNWDKEKLESFGLLREGLDQQEKYQKEQSKFYNQYVPTYTGTAQNIPYYSQLANSQEITGSRDELMRKLNYVVHMLEEQHDEKTGNVTEELVLYMFLGVFVIFVVDSFARVTKYTR